MYAAAAAFLVVGFGLRLAPTSVPRSDGAPLAVPAAAHPDAAPTSTPAVPKYDAIVAANIFSQDRTAPAVRFFPPGRGPAPAPTKPSGPTLKLYGITVGPEGAVALIDADPKIPGAEIYRVGDLVAGAALVAITDSTVTLAEPSGPLVLHLQPVHRKP